MSVFDSGTLATVLQSGAYGAALLYFGYGAYALKQARQPNQNRSLTIYLGLGTVVFLSLAGLDLAKTYLNAPPVERRLYLTFSPTFADIDLPDPNVEYLGRRLSSGEPIVVRSEDSTIAISVQKIIERVKRLQAEKTVLQQAYGQALVAQLPSPFASEITSAAAAADGGCRDDDATCGWVELSNGNLDAAEAAFEHAISSTGAGTGEPERKEALANALHGLGEIYIGRGEVAKANRTLSRASALGSDNASLRLQRLETLERPAVDVAADRNAP